jgi:hypothetical protein
MKGKKLNFFLIPCIRARRMLKSSRMGLGQNDIHEHLLVNSFAHAKQCMWLVQIESNQVTNLPCIHPKSSHNSNLKGDTTLTNSPFFFPLPSFLFFLPTHHLPFPLFYFFLCWTHFYNCSLESLGEISFKNAKCICRKYCVLCSFVHCSSNKWLRFIKEWGYLHIWHHWRLWVLSKNEIIAPQCTFV